MPVMGGVRPNQGLSTPSVKLTALIKDQTPKAATARVCAASPQQTGLLRPPCLPRQLQIVTIHGNLRLAGIGADAEL